MSFGSNLAHLWRTAGFRRLAWVRVLSQSGDGAFQVGIFTSFFFDPQQGTTPSQIALGFAVMFAPFTIVGPFVGPLIDRWHRQRIILVGNLIRVGLAAAIIACVLLHAHVALLYGLALLTLSVNRFLLASLSAGLPRVIGRHDLLMANAVMPTLGTVAATLGAVVAGAAATLVPHVGESGRSVIALTIACAAFASSSLAATRIAREGLGPDRLLDGKDLAAHTVHVIRELGAGIRHLHRQRTPFHALGAMATARMFYALMFVSSLLIARELWGHGDAGAAVAALSIVVAAGAVGFALAVVVTPWLAPRIGHHRWIVVSLLVGAVGQSAVAISSSKAALLVAAAILSFAVQSGKIAVDTIVQRDTHDAFRGRAFALYDVAYNTAFVTAALIGALVLPVTGYSRPVMIGLTVAYVVAALAYIKAPRRPMPEHADVPAVAETKAP